MIAVTGINEMRETAEHAKRGGKRIGVIPTMGFLHEGHRALMRRSREENDFSVLTVFVNPTQFGPKEDFKKYPRDEKRDNHAAGEEMMDVVFRPHGKDMYPTGYGTFVNVEGITDTLEGASRPGHFRGVATVVMKLFQIIQPDNAYFGRKDIQQLAVIRKMAADLNMPVTIHDVPTVRERDGLALSSRNSYLTPDERSEAAVLYKALQKAQSMVHGGIRSREKITEEMNGMIRTAKSASIDYIEIVDSENFRSVQQLEKGQNYYIALAVYFGKTRLIDNIIV